MYIFELHWLYCRILVLWRKLLLEMSNRNFQIFINMLNTVFLFIILKLNEKKNQPLFWFRLSFDMFYSSKPSHALLLTPLKHSNGYLKLIFSHSIKSQRCWALKKLHSFEKLLGLKPIFYKSRELILNREASQLHFLWINISLLWFDFLFDKYIGL